MLNLSGKLGMLAAIVAGQTSLASAALTASAFDSAKGNSSEHLEIALDEIWDSRQPLRTQPILRADNFDGLLAKVDSVAAAAGPGTVIGLVAYPRGFERTDWNRHILTPRLLVRLKPGSRAGSAIPQDLLPRFRPVGFAPGCFLVEGRNIAETWALKRRLEPVPGVVSVAPLSARWLQKKFVPNDPRFSEQWNLSNVGQNGGVAGIDLNLTNAWNIWRGSNVVVAVVDDGLQAAHPDLAPNVSPALGFDYQDDDPDPNPSLFSDVHGTHVAGLIGAAANNSLGISGTAPAVTLVGIRLISGPTTDAQEAAALAHSNQVIHIKNCSWGAGDGLHQLRGPGLLTQTALEYGAQNGRNGLGTVFVFPAGNGQSSGDDANADGYANSIFTLTVGAVNDQGLPTGYSEPGACVQVVAPSGSPARQKIVTTDLVGADGDEPGHYTAEFNGTSASVAMASGVAALVLEANPNLGWRDVQEILMRSARIVDGANPDWITNAAGFHFNHYYGAGLVQAGAALNLATNWINLGPHTNIAVSPPNLPLPIPDNSSAGLVIELPVTNPLLRVEHVTVKLSLSHPDLSQVGIEITAPSGVKSRLLPVGNLQGADIPQWTFTTVRNWGEATFGAWTVVIFDTRFLSAGTLDSLELNLFGSAWRPPVLALAQGDLSYSIALAGQPGLPCRLEDSADLLSWTQRAMLVLTNGSAAFVETNPPAPHRFYRATVHP